MAAASTAPAADPTVPEAAEQPVKAESKAKALASAKSDMIRLLASLPTDEQQKVCDFALQRIGEARRQRHNLKLSEDADSLTNLLLSREKQPEPTSAWVRRDCPKAVEALKAEGLTLPVATGSAGDPLRYFGASSAGGKAAPDGTAGKSGARASSASAASTPRCVREMSAADRAVLDTFADALGRAAGGSEGRRTAVREVQMRAREEALEKLMAWNERGRKGALEELMAWNERGSKRRTTEEPSVEACCHARSKAVERLLPRSFHAMSSSALEKLMAWNVEPDGTVRGPNGRPLGTMAADGTVTDLDGKVVGKMSADGERGDKRETTEKPNVEAWHKAVERKVAAEVAATERLWREAHPRRPRPKKKPSKTEKAAYILFCKDERSKVVAANPDKPAKEISALLSAAWKALGEEEQAKWNAAATEKAIPKATATAMEKAAAARARVAVARATGAAARATAARVTATERATAARVTKVAAEAAERAATEKVKAERATAEAEKAAAKAEAERAAAKKRPGHLASLRQPR